MTLQKAPIRGPFKGIITDLPATLEDQSFDDCENMFCRKGEVQTRNRWNPIAVPPDGAVIRQLYSFVDINNTTHTLVLTDNNAYFVVVDAFGNLTWNPLTLPTGISTTGGSGHQFAIREINQQVYFCDGTNPLMYLDGSQLCQVAGNVPGSCLFLTENSESLIGVNWTEPPPGIQGSQQWPFRVRWTDTGNPQQWISATGNVAGANDIINSGGVLTGCATVGRNTYLFKRFGVTVMFATGSTPTFSFEPFIWSNPGWGSYYPYALVVWGPLIIIITESAEVLMFDGSSFTRLASGKVRSALAQDLALVTSNVPVAFGSASMGPGYDLEAYWLSIPGPNVIWVHDLTEGTWQRMSSASGSLTAMARVGIG